MENPDQMDVLNRTLVGFRLPHLILCGFSSINVCFASDRSPIRVGPGYTVMPFGTAFGVADGNYQAS